MIIDKLHDLENESISRSIPIIGSEKGRWLYQTILETKPKTILELGTANGYSGIILGSLGAKLITIEKDQDIAQEAKTNFKHFKINADVIIGDGVQEIKKLTSKFDLIFIDFAKRKYIEVLEDCIRLLNSNGLIIADNITFECCKNYKEKVLNHPRLKTTIINIKDSLSCSKKE